MYLIKVKHSFNSAHFLAGYGGKCENIHGHRWEVHVEVKSSELVENGEHRGMVADFGDLKRDVREILDYHDHSLIIESGTLKEETLNCLLGEGFKIIHLNFRTTAENFSHYFFNCIKEKGYDVKRITVYETPDNCATYEE